MGRDPSPCCCLERPDAGTVRDRVLLSGAAAGLSRDALDDVTAPPLAAVSLLLRSSCAMRSLMDARRGRELLSAAFDSTSSLTSSSASRDRPAAAPLSSARSRTVPAPGRSKQQGDGSRPIRFIARSLQSWLPVQTAPNILYTFWFWFVYTCTYVYPCTCPSM